MPTWTFNGPKDEVTIVEAATEKEARRKAMIKRWGPGPDRAGTDSNAGFGLWLVSKEG